MAIDMELTPKVKRPAGERCCQPVVYPDVERDKAIRMADVAKALGDPVRLQLVDVLRKHAGKDPCLGHGPVHRLRARGAPAAAKWFCSAAVPAADSSSDLYPGAQTTPHAAERR